VNDRELWERLASDPDLIGGAVRYTDDDGRPRHCRISAVHCADGIIQFGFDRIWFGPLETDKDDPWMEFSPGLVLAEGNDYLWQPITGGFVRLEMQDDGSAKVLAGLIPSYIDRIYPKRALPADSPTTRW
jgi:hypothetical protein